MPNPQETLATFTRNFDHLDLHTPGKFNSSSRTLIETPEQLKTFLLLLSKLKRSTLRAPELSLDYEACKLAGDGDIRVMQMRVRSMNHTFIFDVKKLGGITMFEAKNTKGLSLREVLESNKHIKLMWDCRQDQDALFGIFGIKLSRIIDVQLLELGSGEAASNENLRSLSTAFRRHGRAWMTPTELSEFVRTSAEAKEYFKKSNYGIFGYEDLPDLALEYSAGDVDMIEKLYNYYSVRQTRESWKLVLKFSRQRLQNNVSARKLVCRNELSAFRNLPSGQIREYPRRLQVTAFVKRSAPKPIEYIFDDWGTVKPVPGTASRGTWSSWVTHLIDNSCTFQALNRLLCRTRHEAETVKDGWGTCEDVYVPSVDLDFGFDIEETLAFALEWGWQRSLDG
ncbi:uncharacterized protein RAG0_08365 [Rhynchosporium agropyri]|uniref:3'-5' exonuclease domain-containing protein n=1 Tax=Rhynchosporium agropyri TaxID=914238 RepID=A0A1E1KQK0_9HELO|nr:uncharacterized protein RAG0_08365 [Rhynchosporium agropyri]